MRIMADSCPLFVLTRMDMYIIEIIFLLYILISLGIVLFFVSKIPHTEKYQIDGEIMNKISIPLVALRSESFTWNGDKYRMLLNDKIIYYYMLSKWEYYNKKGEIYTETQPDVAKALNINYHAVNRFVSTAIKLGIIEVVKESRNSMPAYTAIHKVKWDKVSK